uniref:tRNA-uridine aminocarboxypropyltransferase 1 isoform X1 n=1 Tax=Myxine glutinosa TaxID=7769 RepID=UPI00358FFC7A
MAGPFAALRLSCQDALQQRRAAGRSRCPRCGASRMFYCYSCHVLVQDLDPQRVPRVKLPLKVDIIKHPNETDGKSTAVHAKILAPDDVTIYTYPSIPEFYKPDKVLLVFPRPGSLTLEKLMEKQRCARLGLPPIESSDHSREEHAAKRMKCLHGSQPIPGEKKVAGVAPFERAVFIDCTWNQTNKIILDERLQGLQCVELRKHETHFWRRQKGKPSTYLATIEALYYFLEEYEQLVLARPPTGSYDNLLFFYSYMYGLVHSAKADKLYHD